MPLAKLLLDDPEAQVRKSIVMQPLPYNRGCEEGVALSELLQHPLPFCWGFHYDWHYPLTLLDRSWLVIASAVPVAQ